MPANSASTPRAPLTSDANLVRYDEFIDAQIRSTRTMVKAVDMASNLVTIAAGVLAFLLAFAIVEHWLVPRGFSTAARYGLFALLLAGVGYFAFRRLWPLIRRAINPVYAAQTIEQASPSLKNTLVNLLMFREHRRDVSDAVYRTLEEQAAQRLTRVPVDSAVDRGQLIRLGYVLIALVAAAAIYKVVSPKDPVISAERVLMPWSDIVPASRVRIENVTPGHVTVARGDFIDVAAEVRGISENDEVLVRFTTSDGQAVGKSLPMTAADDGFKFAIRLPASDSGGSVGLSQNLTYRIEAGDARSHDFNVTVVSAPAILIDRIDYDYPKYTNESRRTVTGTGDIRAIEGTRVTIHARANGPIDEAFIDFDSDGRRDVRLEHQDTNGKASFVLALREDRQTPRYGSYSLRFTNTEGRENKNPARFPITVLRDYDPEVRLIAPREKSRDIRLDETVTIEVDARDPDFALREVRFRGAAVGRREINAQLLGEPRVGQFTARYQFTPSEHQLRAGDIVEYWVEASDNREPTANLAKTERQTLRIVAPDRPEQPQPNQRNPGQRGDRGQQGSNRGQQDRQQPQPEQGENNQGRDNDSAPADAANDNEKQPPSRGNRNSGDEEEQSRSGERGARGGNGLGGKEGDDSEKQTENSDNNTGRGQSGKSQDSANSDSASNDAGSNGRGENARGASSRGRDSGGERRGSNDSSTDDAAKEPQSISPNGDNDSTAFERIRERLRQNDQLPDDGDAGRQSNTDPNADSANDSAKSQVQPSTEGKSQPNASKSADPATSANKQPAENRDTPPSRGGREAATKEPPGRGNRAGDDQRVRESGKSDPAGEEREQTPSRSNNDEKNTGAPGRDLPDSAGDENPDLKGEQKDSVANRQPNRDGAGTTGQGESADKGAGQSAERGPGNDSQSAGRDVTSAEKTGQSSENTPGRGSRGRETSNGDRDGKQGTGQRGNEQKTSPDGQGEEPDNSGESGAGKSGDGKAAGSESAGGKGQESKAGTSSEGTSPSDTSKSAPASPGDNTTGQRGRTSQSPNTEPGNSSNTPGGDTGPATAGQQEAPGDVPDADAANLDYARRQTDLVLEKLSDQLNKKQVDPELLKDLGWTEDDLRKFVSRWQQRREAARGNSPAAEGAKKELDDALRSLGLRSTQPRQSTARDDQMRDLRSGYRGTVPLEYQERLRAYNRGVSRSRQESK